MKPIFNLTYDIVTEGSAENGDFAYNGFVTRNGGTPLKRNYIPKKPASFGLRAAIAILMDREGEGPVEADSCPISVVNPPRWFTYGGGWRQMNGIRCSLRISLHLPDKTTPSSAMRVARLLNCYGIQVTHQEVKRRLTGVTP